MKVDSKKVFCFLNPLFIRSICADPRPVFFFFKSYKNLGVWLTASATWLCEPRARLGFGVAANHNT